MSNEVEILIQAKYNDEEGWDKTVEQKKCEIHGLLEDVVRFIENMRNPALKDVDFEFTFKNDGEFEYKSKK